MLKTILVFLLVMWVGGWLLRWLLPFLLFRWIRRLQQQMQGHHGGYQKEPRGPSASFGGSGHTDSERRGGFGYVGGASPAGGSRPAGGSKPAAGNVGEYIDYEEIKN